MIDFITQFGLLLIIIVFISFIVKLARQPIILGYVIAGVAFSLLTLKTRFSLGEDLAIFSEIGITFLLFLMGLEFDFKSLRYLGKDILLTTLLQSGIFFGLGFSCSMLFGFSPAESIYIGILLMFSSTLLVAKWVEDKKEGKTLHGKIILGTLILQDILAIAALTVISIFREHSFISIITVPLKGIVLVLIAIILSRHVLEKLLKFASRYPELLFIFSMSICFLFVEIAPLLGYSTTIGAFIGGIVLANTIYRTDISSRLKPLVTFFNMLFFVGLGYQMDLLSEPRMLMFAAIMAAMALIIKPFVIYITLRWRGYDTKSSFLSGLYLAQASEFGIIIIASGIMDGFIGSGLNTTGIVVVILTMLISSYYIKYSSRIFSFYQMRMKWVDSLFRIKDCGHDDANEFDYNIVFFGYYDLGAELLDKMNSLSKKIVVVENDPEKIELLKKDGWHYIYNSVNNAEFFSHIPFEKVELVVSSLVDMGENKMIIRELKSRNKDAVAIVTAKSVRDSVELYDNNADYVILTSYLNDQQVSVLLEDYTTDMHKVISKKIIEHARLKEIQKKRERARGSQRFSFYEIPYQYRTGMNLLKKKLGSIVNGKGKADVNAGVKVSGKPD